MIKELRLENFRGFDDHRIPFNPRTTIVVGKNNAGKSTIVEALRLVSLITRYQRLDFQPVPGWLDRPKREKGVSPSLQKLELNLEGAFHRYSDPPAIITCTFQRGESVTIYISHHARIHAVIRDANGGLIVTTSQAGTFKLPKVQILPQIAPLEETENVLGENYVKRHMITSRSSLHFRNQLKVNYEHFHNFKKIAERTWPGLRVTSLEGRDLLPGQGPLSLLIQDTDFVAEVGWMGHGLQMWLQTMWFLTYSEGADVIILDEPDVYMHADLQRRLIRFVKDRDWQSIIATHSMEMMAEVEPEEVLVVDRRKDKSTFAPSLPAVQRVVNHVGSIHNIQLARMWSSKTLLLVEGKDIAILKRFQNKLFPESEKPFDALPNLAIGGWGGWRLVGGSSFILKNAGGEEIITYCFLDSDYHHDEQIEARYKEAEDYGVQLHIWSVKEIENFVIVPAAIQRVIVSGCKAKIQPPNIADIESEIWKIAENLRENTFDCLCTEYATKKAWSGATVNKMARERVASAWKTLEGCIGILPGKEVISLLSGWSQKHFCVSFNAVKLANSLERSEVHREIIDAIEAIENHEVFPHGSKQYPVTFGSSYQASISQRL